MATDITQKPGLATWTIDPMHSTAEFSVKHMMISSVKGRFGVISGALQYDGSDLTTASVEATIGQHRPAAARCPPPVGGFLRG